MDGFLCIDKPQGITSRDAVNHVQRRLERTKVGHAGTLDPMATGVLVVATGKATRLVPYVQRSSKQYTAHFVLGKTSDTEDVTGDVRQCDVAQIPTRARVEATCRQFVGNLMQRPPKFSALHVRGKRAYDLARKGEAFDLKARPVIIHDLKVLTFDYPNLKIEICCGSGTYIRSVGRDIGEVLGCGAVMADLRRTAVGGFRIESASELADLKDAEAIQRHLTPPIFGLAELEKLALDEDQVTAISFGQTIQLDSAADEVAAIAEDERLVAILVRKTGSWFRPAINFAAR